MRVLAVFLVVFAVLHGRHSAFIGIDMLPDIPVSPEFIMTFSLLEAVVRELFSDLDARPGTVSVESSTEKQSEESGLLVFNATTTATTEKPEVRVVPASAVENLHNVNQNRQHRMDLLFTFLKELDGRKCVSRLVCESAADAQRLGRVGNSTVQFFNSNLALKTGRGSVFLAAAETGRSRGLAGCAQEFADCTADLRHLLTVAGLIALLSLEKNRRHHFASPWRPRCRQRHPSAAEERTSRTATPGCFDAGRGLGCVRFGVVADGVGGDRTAARFSSASRQEPRSLRSLQTRPAREPARAARFSRNRIRWPKQARGGNDKTLPFEQFRFGNQQVTSEASKEEDPFCRRVDGSSLLCLRLWVRRCNNRSSSSTHQASSILWLEPECTREEEEAGAEISEFLRVDEAQAGK
ncbi:hypothetical protein HPB50_019479 [Hyalomma asiaticum]|uniref:Uncharacterized protein n=1 Tax=Hyalomma asiaticum TaxID=266040 RepID=A0ACB7SLK6_HYAAI|nr:hypothetical protein HPB50_019479 [Hyalomma asiaticum]